MSKRKSSPIPELALARDFVPELVGQGMEAKGCPWCATLPEVKHTKVKAMGTGYVAICGNGACLVLPCTYPRATPADALTLWNQRAVGSPPAVADERKGELNAK